MIKIVNVSPQEWRKKKKIRYRGDLEKGYDEFETYTPFYICPLNHKIEE